MVAASKPTSWLSSQLHILPHLTRTSGPKLMVRAVPLSTTDLSTRGLTPGHQVHGIRSLTRLGNPCGPRTLSVLYLRDSKPEASPKAISGRTSYLRVRLAFHPYPHLIPALFNVRGFGPPAGVTRPSPWTWVDHLVSGRRRRTQTPYSDSLSLRLRLFGLTSHAIVTRRFILQKARHHP